MTGTQASPEAPPSLTIDWQAYAAMLEESDWSDAQKRELIETLWSIVVAFVDLGFGVHPAQQACGQPGIQPPAARWMSGRGVVLQRAQHAARSAGQPPAQHRLSVELSGELTLPALSPSLQNSSR